jgi:small subunit ribosomal protein S20
MAITKSAKKAIRQSERKRVKNLRQTRSLKALLKEVKSLALQKKTEEAQKLLSQAYKLLDKAAKTNLIKKNTASRRKSRLSKLLAKSAK